MKHLGTLALMLLLALGCGGSGESSDQSDNTSGGSDDDWDDDWGDDEVPVVESNHGAIEHFGITPPEKPWDEMTHEEREWDMIGRILPIMKEVFGEHDAERFAAADYGCATCHGDDGPERAYAMPPSVSYPVPPANTPEYENMKRIFGPMVTFMEDQVTPTMGTLVGNEEYSCHNCHPSTEPAEPEPRRRGRRGRRGGRGR